MASAEHEPITEVWGQSPQRGPGAEPLVGWSGGEAPLKLKVFWSLDVYGAGKFSPFPKMSSTAGNESSNCQFVVIA